MSLRSLSLCILLLRFHPIFSPHTLAASDAAGKFNLYNDFNCNHPSTLNPLVTLPLYTCLVTPGGEGLVVAELPPCSQSSAAPIFYQDSVCGIQVTISTDIFTNKCFQMADGPTLFNARSVMFSCQPAANNPLPSSTTTAVVSALAAVATGSTGGSGSNGSNGSSGSTSATSTMPTETSTQKNSTGSSGSNGNGGPSTSTSTSTSSHLGLTTGDIIALAVGLGIGIPTIAVMLGAWLFPDFRHKLRRLV